MQFLPRTFSRVVYPRPIVSDESAMRAASLSHAATTPEAIPASRMSEKEPPPGRRRGYRQKLDTAAMLRPATSRGAAAVEPMMVHVFDLSMFGVGFSSRKALEIGAIFRFAMCDRRQAGSRVEVRSCRQRPDGMFDVGAQFC